MTARYARLSGVPGGPRPSPRGAWVRIGGTGAAAGVGLALLVLVTVAISVALPRFSVSHRTTALRRTLSTVPAASTAVLANLPYITFDVEFNGQPLTAADLTAAGSQLAAGLAGQGLPLARPFWSGLSAAYATVTGAGPGTVSALPPEMEILYRDQLTPYGRLTAGRLPQQGVTSHGQVVLQVAVTGATAARYGLRPGSRLGMGPDVTLEVTGIVTPVDPGSAFWGVDPIAAAPALNFAPPPASSPYWIGACFIGPAEVPLLQASVPTTSMQVSWAVPLSLTHLSAGQVPALTDRLSGALADGGMVQNADNGAIGGGNMAVPLSSGLLAVLSGFTAEDQAIGAVLGLLFVSLAAIGIVAVVLAAALVAARRGPEFAVMRARGASLRQVAGRAMASSAAFTLPAATAGAGLAVLLTPGGNTAISWWLAGCGLAAALGGVPLLVVARLRSSGGVRRRRARFTPAAVSRRMAVVRRLVAEAGLAAAAVGGIIVLRWQGLSAGSVDVYSSAAPVLVAVLAAIVVVHVYPVLLRLLLRLARARPGVSAFVGLSQATRSAPGTIAVVFALVLALAMVAFGTMIDDAAHRGEVAESWRQVGADAVIYASASSRPATPAVQREVAAVPGAARTAAVPVATGTLSSGANVTVALVNPAAYAALVAGTPAPAFPAASLARRPGPVPALVSAGAATQLPPGPARLTVGGRPLTVRPAGLARAIPGVPGGPFVVLPAWALGRAVPAPSVILVVGPHLDTGRLAAVVRRDLPGASVVFRDSALSALTGAPLPAAAHAVITAAAAAAAAFSALILLISLLMSAPSREMTVARLSTMGLGRGQGRWLAGMETLPQVLAAIAGGVASAWVLGPLIAPSISLSAFTGSASGVAFKAEPLPLVACATGLILVAVLALAVQFLMARRRGVARPLRAGE
jgi:putative ABC transport system permease protein